MSRSRKKTPISGITTSESEKDEKKAWHRVYRRKVNSRIRNAEGEADLPHFRSVSDPWSMSKDGKFVFDEKTLPQLKRK